MDFKHIWTLAKPHLIAMGIFLAVFAAYFHPQLNGQSCRAKRYSSGERDDQRSLPITTKKRETLPFGPTRCLVGCLPIKLAHRRILT